MSFDWSDFLTYAKSLELTTDAARKRTSISRSYYAAYGTAVARLTADNITIPRGVNTHEYVWWYFELEPVARDASQTIGDLSWELKRKRIQADYRDTVTFDTRDTQQAVFLASAIINSIRAVGRPFRQRTIEDFEASR